MDIRESLDFSEENKELRRTIQRITQRLCNMRDTHALAIIQEECGVSIDEILDPKIR